MDVRRGRRKTSDRPMRCHDEAYGFCQEELAPRTPRIPWTTMQPRQFEMFLFCLLLNTEARLAKRGETAADLYLSLIHI